MSGEPTTEAYTAADLVRWMRKAEQGHRRAGHVDQANGWAQAIAYVEDDLPAIIDAALVAEKAKVARAYDNLGGMWSWHDAYLDAPEHGHLWIVRAGRILREVVGRPSHQPNADTAEAAE